MADELDEGLLHEEGLGRVGRHHVDGAVERKGGAEFADLDELADHAEPTEARQPVVPDLGQQLLDVRMGNELLLLVIDGQLETLEWLTLAGLPVVALRIVVEHDLELVRGARVVQQRGRERLHVLAHLLRI